MITVALHPFKNIVAVGGNGDAVFVIGIDIREKAKQQHSLIISNSEPSRDDQDPGSCSRVDLTPYSDVTGEDFSQFRRRRQTELASKNPQMKYSTKERIIWGEV